MARRIPKEEPHLRWTDESIKSDPRIQRRRGVIPHQSTLSVQNIPDVSTPAGTAMVNEEFRRLRLAIAAKGTTATTTATGDTTTAISTTPTASPALTVEESDVVIAGNQVQILNFEDSDTVKFSLDKGVVDRNESKHTIDQTLGNSKLSKPQKVNISAKVDLYKPKYVTGVVYINQLVVPSPPVVQEGDWYKYLPVNYDPNHGKYGWYVYQTIQHDLSLTDKNSYLLNMVDLHEYDDIDGDMPVSFPGRFELQQGIFEHEGLDTNKIIIRGVYKPDLHYYYGTKLPQTLEYIDEPAGIVRTNLIFRYTIFKI